MNHEIAESIRVVFEELKKQYDEIETKIKDDASRQISDLIANNKFDESQTAVQILKNLLKEIHFDYDFDEIYNSIQKYAANMEALMAGREVSSWDSHQATKAASPSEAVNSKPEHDSSFMTYIEEKFANHQFRVVNVSEDNIEIEKNKKHFHLTVDRTVFAKEDYFHILEKKNDLKNIGFVCTTEDDLKKVKSYSEEYVQSIPDHKRKFLSINITTKNRLGSKHGQLFETVNG